MTAGSSRFTLPFWIFCTRSLGSASTSTFSPTASAVFGLTPGPTPPRPAPSIAWCNFSVSPQNAWSPKVSKRKVCSPCCTFCIALSTTGFCLAL